MGNQTNQGFVERMNQHPPGPHGFGYLCCGFIALGHIEDDDIRLNQVRINGDSPAPGKKKGQVFGLIMGGLQPFQMMIQGIDPGGCQNACLTHPAPEHFPKAVNAIDKRGRSGHQGTYGGSQSL